MEGIIRLLPYADADGPTNMAADETLLDSAVAGVASLRFYGWTSATASLGYFQPAKVRLSDVRLARLPFVRRPSGGSTLVHHHELTYAFAIPAGPPWHTHERWLSRMHRIIRTALAELGVSDAVESAGEPAPQHGEVLCFHQVTACDLLCAGKKFVGSAQRKHRQAMMQHGSILLAQSEHTPALPGIRELAGISLSATQVRDAVVRAFAADTSWAVNSGPWLEKEDQRIRELAAEKYATVAWNEKR